MNHDPRDPSVNSPMTSVTHDPWWLTTNHIGVARINNWGWPKMEEWSEWPIKHLWFYLYGFYRATLCVGEVFAVVRCPSVCHVGVLVYCIHMAEDIVNFFLSPVAHHSRFLTPAPVPNSKGTPSVGAQNTRGGKILRFSTEIAVHLWNGTR